MSAYNAYKARVESEINYYNRRIDRLSSRINRRTEKGRNASWSKKRLEVAQSMKLSFENVMSELTELMLRH